MAEFIQHGKAENNKRYHYTECGLDDVYLVNGFTERATPYGKGVAVDNVDGLHHAIAKHICCNKPLMNGKEFRFLRKLMDMTQAEVAILLGCDAQTVARWEKGETEIKGPVDKIIRLLTVGFLEGAIIPLEIVQRVSNIDEKINNDMLFKESKGHWKPAMAA